MKDKILDIEHLSVSFNTFEGEFAAVRDVSLSLGFDQSIGIIGESGCGKSTLAYSIMRYVASNAKVEGSIKFKGENLLEKTEQEMANYRGNRIAMVYQNPSSSLNPALTIGFQLDEVSIIHQKLNKTEARKASIEALSLMNIGDPKGIVRRYPHQISGGIQQRICIAMAILCRPDLMILDEPTTALDVTTEATILDSIKVLRDTLHMSLIYISHDMGVINKVAEQVVVMYNGEIVEQGPKEKIFEHPFHPYTRALINCMPRGGVVKENTRLNTIPGYVKRRGIVASGCPYADRCDQHTTTCEALLSFRKVADQHFASCDRAYAIDGEELLIKKKTPRKKNIQHQVEQTEEPLLELQNVNKVYGTLRKVYAVNDISVSVKNGTVMGIVGESGCGKSTTGHMVSGLFRPTTGKILFEGQDISIAWNKRSAKTLKDIQLIFQNPGKSLNPSHTVEQIIGRPMKRLSNIDSAEERKEKIIHLLHKVDLGKEYLLKKPNQLSGGEQQRVAIARALSISPKLIVCDEPTSALDVSVQASVLNLLNDLQLDTQVTYLFISHDLNVINYLSDTIMVMYAGKICEFGTRDEVMSPPYHPYTEALLSAIPEVDPTKQKEPIRLYGQLPNPSKKLKGCPFAGRCPKKVGSICETEYPPMVKISDSHYYYCHIKPELDNK
ncbi:ABC transporter ATP-binding protein [uncultured Sphaerochaeta sp.]|uniref:ABC transporter ATP-binding protein n=1 Tax=uncultured Sphaerochaeta sp. TaxID=886478 RepID=UPI002A0A2BDE|nr:ABC transporter ATP-binding protein [uncultured Sphaerochaeta sp.]